MSEQSMDVENPTPKPQQIDVCGDGGVLKEILKKGKGTRPYVLSLCIYFHSNVLVSKEPT